MYLATASRDKTVRAVCVLCLSVRATQASIYVLAVRYVRISKVKIWKRPPTATDGGAFVQDSTLFFKQPVTAVAFAPSPAASGYVLPCSQWPHLL